VNYYDYRRYDKIRQYFQEMGPAEKELRENGRKQEQGNGLEIFKVQQEAASVSLSSILPAAEGRDKKEEHHD